MVSRNQILSSFFARELSASSVNSQRRSLDIVNCLPYMARYCGRSIRDPSFSYSLAKISHDLTFGDSKCTRSARRSSPQQEESQLTSGCRDVGAHRE